MLIITISFLEKLKYFTFLVELQEIPNSTFKLSLKISLLFILYPLIKYYNI